MCQFVLDWEESADFGGEPRLRNLDALLLGRRELIKLTHHESMGVASTEKLWFYSIHFKVEIRANSLRPMQLTHNDTSLVLCLLTTI